MLITCHWSASGPSPVTDYHVEFALTRPIPSDIQSKLNASAELAAGEVDRLAASFDIWKFMSFDQIPVYATWHLNRDPRDGSTPNVAVAALCMGGEGVNTSGPWGRWPFTLAHAYIMSGIAARICQLKGLDAVDSFSSDACTYSAQMNGAIYNISTHAERASTRVTRTAGGTLPHCEWRTRETWGRSTQQSRAPTRLRRGCETMLIRCSKPASAILGRSTKTPCPFREERINEWLERNLSCPSHSMILAEHCCNSCTTTSPAVTTEFLRPKMRSYHGRSPVFHSDSTHSNSQYKGLAPTCRRQSQLALAPRPAAALLPRRVARRHPGALVTRRRNSD